MNILKFLIRMEYSKVIKFVSTCWLSFQFFVIRELEKNEGLRTSLLSEETNDKRFQRFYEAFI